MQWDDKMRMRYWNRKDKNRNKDLLLVWKMSIFIVILSEESSCIITAHWAILQSTMCVHAWLFYCYCPCSPKHLKKNSTLLYLQGGRSKVNLTSPSRCTNTCIITHQQRPEGFLKKDNKKCQIQLAIMASAPKTGDPSVSWDCMEEKPTLQINAERNKTRAQV